MDGCCLLNIKWSSAAMIDFQLDPLMTLFFFHFLREFVCCLYKVVRNRKAEPISFFDLVAAVKKPQNAFASCRVLLRPSGLISFAFFHRRVEWIIFYDAIGFSSSSRCFQLALINELPVRPSVRWCGIKQQNRGGSFSFRVFVFCNFGNFVVSACADAMHFDLDERDAIKFLEFRRLPCTQLLSITKPWRTLTAVVGWTKPLEITKRIGRTAVAQKKMKKALPFGSDRPLRIFFSNRRTRSMQMNDVDDDEPWSRSSRRSLAFIQHGGGLLNRTTSNNNNNNWQQVCHR